MAGELYSAEQQTNTSDLKIEIDVVKEYRTYVHQKMFALYLSISVSDFVSENQQLKASIVYSDHDFENYDHVIEHDELDSGETYKLNVPPAKHANKDGLCLFKEQPLVIKASITSNGEQVATISKTIKLLPPADLVLDVASVYSVVFQQNQFPLISRLELRNESSKPFRLTTVCAEFDPPDFEQTTWTIDEIVAGQSVSLKEKMLKISAKALEELTERRLVQLKFSVYADDVLVIQKICDVELLPKNHWGGELHMPELLAAFVTPNTNFCDALLKKSSNLLAKEGHESQLDGYQSNTRERPYMVAAALWSILCREGISYCVPPANFAASGQRIRLSSDIPQSLLATCLDTALLFAGCLEQAGLNSVIALTKGHAMVGVWLINESFPTLTSNDPIDLRNRIALNDLILFETTLATNDRPIKFSQAIQEANRKISEKLEKEFVYVLDVKQARSRKISPINIGDYDNHVEVDGIDKADVELPPTPVLPPVNEIEVLGKDLAPDDRIKMWSRKLLDLSKKNKLLNIQQRSMGFRILSPDLGTLEDELAAGKTFNVISRDSLTAEGRSSGQFTRQTGGSLEDETVGDQLRRGCLIADCNEKELEKNLINLFRRAKSDLEEGGSNTLFLAIGMLRWKEDARSEQFYRAPLILFPVKLDRTSARAKPKLRKLPDEDPVFNLTLIELLQQDFEIDLSIFQSSLPEDNSGIDIDGIWQTVRSKIKDTPGFEVIEDLVLSNFSFAKYLMWKDLSDREDDLRSSPFVEHLVENPTDPYPHIANFIDACDVDTKIAPETLFAPLNADSSQIVAIDASAKGVDFVMEGPPGTGKSETIANIISHNIALGRKVLFVSEKMAALDVVYSRLNKVGLGHLCLELHSNKVSKRAVINQLGESWQSREKVTKLEWTNKAIELASLRKHLNQYVEELHRTSSLGYSAREAIARATLGGDTCRVNLDWPMDLTTAPVKKKGDIKNLIEAVENLGLAFIDLDNVSFDSFSFIKTADWSNIWQVELLNKAKNLNEKIDSFSSSLTAFIAMFFVQLKIEPSYSLVCYWRDLADIVIGSVGQSLAFALSTDAKNLIDGLTRLSALKKRFDISCQAVALTCSPNEISNLPVKEWNNSRLTLSQKGTILERYQNDASILNKLQLDGLSIEVEKSPERQSLFDEMEFLSREAYCNLGLKQLISLPLSDWLKKHEQTHSSAEGRFVSDKEILILLSEYGFEVSENIVADKRTKLDSLQREIDELLAECNCSLDPISIVALPISEWINIRDEASNKNVVTRFFAKQNICKQMKQHGLEKTDSLEVLDGYQKLVDGLVRIQSTEVGRILETTQSLITKKVQEHRLQTDQVLNQYTELCELSVEILQYHSNYSGDEVLESWTTSSQEILERKAYGASVRNTVMAAANQVDAPDVFINNVRLLLIDRREFLESSELLRQAESLVNEYNGLNGTISAFKTHANSPEINDLTFEKVKASLNELLETSHYLNAWCHWTDAKNKVAPYDLKPIIFGLESGLISSGEVVEQFKTAFCIWLAPLLVDQSEVLRNFSATKHGALIDKFRSLDEEVASTTGQFVAAKLASEMPETSGPNAPHEYGVLSRELQKKTRHKPVRQLIHELGQHLLSLTPCFMMSPLSVAQFLPSNYDAFDLVVFDEASQITVWDAVGAIGRGKNVIVAGDPKQMPPTNFFNRSQGMDDSDEADLESILDQAMAAGVAYHRLTGHYRSRHESLIAFSNHQYYQNTLATYPCADTRASAVLWHKVDGLYTKGSARNNPIEAQALVAEVVRRLKDPELQQFSIGIVTFNTEQQRLIEDLLDFERRKNPLLERFFKDDAREPVFVKNLETVQGDQRDVICLSVGYGPTEPGAQTMSMNFGPLNRQGGERRLNVAITRAATEMLVFTSFDATMIDLSRTSSEAVRDLKAYIDYAARGPVALAQRTQFDRAKDTFDSGFEEAVALRLREKGWEIRTQIGVSKFRIDLGVLNPDSKGTFLAGIECDGATYHSSPSARDRDRVRHIILENLGWKLVRIWSTDYFINPDKIIENVHRQLESLLSEAREKFSRINTEDMEVFDSNVDAIKIDEDEVFFDSEVDDSLEIERSQQSKTESEKVELIVTDIDTAKIDEAELIFDPGFDISVGHKPPQQPEREAYCSVSSPVSLPTVSEYNLYDGPATVDPRTLDNQRVTEGIISIVGVEGPMLAKRAYDTYLRHCGIKRMGKDLKKLMNRALQAALNNGAILKEDELDIGGLIYTIIRTPNQKSSQLRKRGGRLIHEIPLNEIREASKLIMMENAVTHSSEEHLRLILELYGLKRLTDHTRERIKLAIDSPG